MRTRKYILGVIALALLVASCSDNNTFGTNTDINWPLPIVKTVTANPMVGDTITITGQYFDGATTATIDGIAMKVLSQDSVNMVAVLPRIFNAAPIIVRNAYGRYSENIDIVKPIYPADDDIYVSTWASEIVRNRPLIIIGENMDLVTQVVIGSTTIDVNGLTQRKNRLSVLVPISLSETSSTIILKTIIGSTMTSAVLPVTDYDPSNWTSIPPEILANFEDGLTHYFGGDMPSTLCTAQINRTGVKAAEGNNFFSLYASNITGSYSMWSYLGSVKLTPTYAVNLAEFHDPYISFLWNSDDNIGSFQVAVAQGNATGGGTFAPGKTDATYDQYTALDAYTLRPTNKQWQRINVKLSTFIVENWGNFSALDLNGQISSIELVFKQINGVYWNGTYSKNPDDIYKYDSQSNHQFKANIDQIMITDGPYPGL